MSKKVHENFYINALFSLKSFSCECEIQKIPTKPGRPAISQLLVGSIPDLPLRFAFAPKEGLVRLNEDGTISERDILGSFLKTERHGMDGYKSFFEENGFLFPLNDSEYTKIDIADIEDVAWRMKVTLDLLSMLGGGARKLDAEKRFPRLICDCLVLMFSEQARIASKDSSISYVTAQHPIKEWVEQATDRVPEIINGFMRHEDAIDITETDGTITHIDRDEWNTLRAGDGNEAERDERYRSIAWLFGNGRNVGRELRIQAEALFHLYHDYGVVKSFEDGIELYSGRDLSKAIIDDKLKAKFIQVAKILVKEELDHNIKGVTPVYDVQNLVPRWNVDSLMSAMYFSIFYLKPDVELMKPCANPNCGKYFKVSRTDSKKIYCSPECRNRMSQTNHRKRKNGN